MIDLYLIGKIAPECLKIYLDIATSCIWTKGVDRPTMGEVEIELEHAPQLQESADAESKDGEYYCPIDEYTCNDFWGFASPAIVEYTSSSSLPELEEFLSDSDSLREYIWTLSRQMTSDSPQISKLHSHKLSKFCIYFIFLKFR